MLLAILLAALATSSGGQPPALGDTLLLELPVPGGWHTTGLSPDSTFAILWQTGDSAAVVPLVLDTLRLPPLAVHRDGDTAFVDMHPIPLRATMPDTAYSVSFPAPVDPRIPRGLPGEHLDRHRYWESLASPGSGWHLYAAAAAVSLAAAAAYLLLGRRGEKASEDAPAETPSLCTRAHALLDEACFAAGDWGEFYSRYDAILRAVINCASGIDCRPLTYTQVGVALSSEPEGTELWAEALPLAREVVLQRYAGWGSGRERAVSHVRRLAALAERWCG